MLRFDDIVFGYGEADGPKALSNVSLSVAPGEQVAVLGANGSGKSTLARLGNAILLPQAGTVTVDEIDTRDQSRLRELREKIGIVFQRPDDQIVATSVEDDVAFGPENLGCPRQEIRRRVDESLAAVGLTGLEHREPHLLSGGQKQRLAIAGALAMHPTYLVLDEPTSMLDPSGRADVLAIVAGLRASGHGILHITHDLADVADADRVVVLDRGAVAYSGSLTDLAGDEELLAWCGLELPPLFRLAKELRALGADIGPGVASPEAIAESLWR